MQSEAIQRYETQSSAIIEEARAIVIVDDTTRELASEFSSRARAAIKAIDEEFKPDIAQAHALHKSLLDRVKALKAPFEKAQQIVDGLIRQDYLDREAERRRKEREAQELADAERKRQEDELAAETAEALESGDVEKAQELAETRVAVAPAIPIAPVTKSVASAFGTTTVKKDIKVEVVDKKAIIKAVADGDLPDTLLTVDLGMAKRYAKAANRETMPGFSITEDAVISGRVR